MEETRSTYPICAWRTTLKNIRNGMHGQFRTQKIGG